MKDVFVKEAAINDAAINDAAVKYVPRHAKPVSEHEAAPAGRRALAVLGQRSVGRHAAPQREGGTAVPEKRDRELTAAVA